MRDRAQQVAGQVVDTVQETANRLVGSGPEGSSSGRQGDGQGTPVIDQATEQVTSRVDLGKAYVAETMNGVAQALRKAGHELREETDQPFLAEYAERGAERVERLGGYLRERDTSAIVSDVERFARRQPMLFAGGAFALGMLAVRFFKSGGQSSSSMGSESYRGATSSMHGTGVRASSATLPSAPSTPPGGYTRAAQEALHRPSSSQATTLSGASSPAGTGTSSGPAARPATGSGTSSVQPGRSTPTGASPGSSSGASGPSAAPASPRATSTPPGGGVSGSSGTSPSGPSEPGTQSGGSAPSASERAGTGGRSQP